MTSTDIYEDIAQRTGGDIYIGVVGPVRSGKSTLIQRFMEKMILPNMENEFERERAKDEMPQSSGGKTVMTTEPKFVPDEAVLVHLGTSHLNMKFVDCVGYVVPSAAGQMEGEQPRMVMTPWSQAPMPFKEAAELGTKKVITDHATIGMVVTTDATIGEIPRSDYEEAEGRVIAELQKLGKPFGIILNSKTPQAESSVALAYALEEKYHAPVALVNCLELDSEDLEQILAMVLSEFPVKELRIDLPAWTNALSEENPLRKQLLQAMFQKAKEVEKSADIDRVFSLSEDDSHENTTVVKENDYGTGKALIEVKLPKESYYQQISAITHMEIPDEAALLQTVQELAVAKEQYDRVASALEQVQQTGYGIVLPSVSDLELHPPRLVKQAGGYGVCMRATAPSIHMIRANIETEVNPIVGNKEQSEELLSYLQREMEDHPQGVWEYSIFGKTLQELMENGMEKKFDHLPTQARAKLQETLERAINEGSGGMICILL